MEKFGSKKDIVKKVSLLIFGIIIMLGTLNIISKTKLVEEIVLHIDSKVIDYRKIYDAEYIALDNALKDRAIFEFKDDADKYSMTYTVKEKDTIYNIAQKMDSTTDIILGLNHKIIGKNGESMMVGMDLLVPPINDAMVYQFDDSLDTSQIEPPIRKWKVTSGFGTRLHPVLKRYVFHKGVDLKASIGTPVYAGRKGIIKYAAKMGAYGKIVIIDFQNGYSSKSAHLSKIVVKKGQLVKKGELIGYTGKSGRVTGPHLHYEIIKNGRAIDPVKFHRLNSFKN